MRPDSRGSRAYRELARELAMREEAERVRVERVSPVGPVMEVLR